MSETNERIAEELLGEYLYTYAITVKPLSKSKVYYQNDIDSFISKHIWPYFDIKDRVYEIDNDNTLHCHLIATGNNNTHRHRKIRYWHQDIQELGTLDEIDYWNRYIHKDSKNKDQQEQILWEHYASTEYLFS